MIMLVREFVKRIILNEGWSPTYPEYQKAMASARMTQDNRRLLDDIESAWALHDRIWNEWELGTEIRHFKSITKNLWSLHDGVQSIASRFLPLVNDEQGKRRIELWIKRGGKNLMRIDRVLEEEGIEEAVGIASFALSCMHNTLQYGLETLASRQSGLSAGQHVY